LDDLEEAVDHELDDQDRPRLEIAPGQARVQRGVAVVSATWQKTVGTKRKRGRCRFELQNGKITSMTGDIPFGKPGEDDARGSAQNFKSFTVTVPHEKGLDISSGTIVAGGSAGADFSVYIQSDHGEIMGAGANLYESNDDLDDMTQAPDGGYKEFLQLDNGICFYVMTSENNYAKAQVVSIGAGVQVKIVYRPDGKRQF